MRSDFLILLNINDLGTFIRNNEKKETKKICFNFLILLGIKDLMIVGLNKTIYIWGECKALYKHITCQWFKIAIGVASRIKGGYQSSYFIQ